MPQPEGPNSKIAAQQRATSGYDRLGAPGGEYGAVQVVAYGGDPPNRLDQIVSGQRERQPQEAFQRAVQTEPRPRRQADPDVLGGAGQGAGDRPVEFGPEH